MLASSLMARAYADDIFKGRRFSKTWQADERFSYYKDEKDVEIFKNNFVLKYCDGDKSGKWGLVSLPYRLGDSQKGSSNGLGDITLGFGPRGRIDNFHWLLYGALTFPTGSFEKKLGNGRLDKKIGGFFTYLTAGEKFEIDGALEYNYTGKNKNKINPPDEIYAGLLAGVKITDNVRFVTGFTDIIRNNIHSMNYRSVIRYTVSPALHFELMGDIGIKNKNIIRGNSLTLLVRYNFEMPVI